MRRPNIVVIYTDQMRADCLSAAGHPDLVTPNLDRLANEGVMFEQAFTCYPLCTPSRAAFMTGQYPHSNGVCGNHKAIGPQPVLLGQVLRQAGYETCYIGKLHLSGGVMPGFVDRQYRCGFEEFVGCNCAHDYFCSIHYRNDSRQPLHEPGFQPDIQTDLALEFIERPREGSFALVLSLGTPHAPCITPQRYASQFDPSEITLYPGTDADAIYEQGAYGRLPIRQWLAEYYRQVVNIDENVGRVLDKLDECGLSDDTLVLFTSDHADMAGQLGHCGKTWGHYGATQVPLLLRWPGRLLAGERISALVDASVDTLPSIMDALDMAVPPVVQGRSYLPLVSGEVPRTREAVFYEMIEWKGRKAQPFVPLRGVRTAQYAYVRLAPGVDVSPRGTGSPEAPLFFDRTEDPYELNNAADDPAYDAVRRELDGRITEHMDETGDDWKICAGHWPPAQGYMTGREGWANHQRLMKIAKPDPVLRGWSGWVDRMGDMDPDSL